MVVLENSHLRVHSHLTLMVTTWSFWVAPVVVPVVIRLLILQATVPVLRLLAHRWSVHLVTFPLIAVVLSFGREETLRSLVLASESNTGPRLMHLAVSSNDTKATNSIVITPAMSAIHRRPFDVKWLRPPLLMRITCLGRRQQCILRWIIAWLMLLIMNNNFLPTAALIRASVCENLVISYDVTDSVANLGLAHSLKRTSRWCRWVVLMCNDLLLDRLLHWWLLQLLRLTSDSCLIRARLMITLERNPDLITVWCRSQIAVNVTPWVVCLAGRGRTWLPTTILLLWMR